MKKLCLLLTLLPFLMFSQNSENFLLNMSEITVKLRHDAQFVDGVKKYKKCYIENKGTGKWNTWHRTQGKGNVYIFADTMKNWAEMDESGDAANKACGSVIQNFVLPHIESIENNIASSMLKYSKKSSDNVKLVWVAFFKVNNSTSFMKAIKEISSAVKQVEGDNRGYWYSVMGGSPEMANYFISIPFKNYASLDMKQNGVWTIYEKLHGKKKTDALRAKTRASTDESWSYIYKLNEKMSLQ